MNIGLIIKTFAFHTTTLGSFGIVVLSPLTTAQTVPPILQTLPPPPAVPLPNPPPTPDWPTEPLTVPSQTSSKPSKIEFRASQANISQLYRVEVYGTSQLHLTRVRRIASQAFVRQREGVIQVGVFEDQQRAEDLVQKLAMESLWARIVLVGSY